MKNIQVIDGALNAVYDVFAASDEDFALIFPDNTDIAFAEDFEDSSAAIEAAFARLWANRVPKAQVQGIHGTLFYGLEHKRRYYPTRRDAEAVNPDGTKLRQPRTPPNKPLKLTAAGFSHAGVPARHGSW
jgi:hypothetical protein